MTPLNLYIVDDEESVRRQLTDEIHLLLPGYVVHVFTSGERFLEAIDLQQHGVAVLDQEMDPGMSGSEVFDRLREAGSPLCVLFLSDNAPIPLVVEQMRKGAISWLDKWGAVEERIVALKQAQQLAMDRLHGGQYRQERLRLWNRLTLREQQVVTLTAVGKSSKEIAQHLSTRHPEFPIGHRVVENHRAKAYAKLDVTGAPRSVSINVIVSVVMQLLQGELRHRKVRASLVLGDGLPDVLADHILLEQVVLNLVTNSIQALQYMPVWERTLSIETGLKGREVLVTIRDNGPGISEGAAEQVMLNFCKTSIEEYSGRLEFCNRRPSGAIVTIYLPATDKP